MSSKSEVKKLKCPQCGAEIMFKVKKEIDIPDDLVYKKKILNNKLFTMSCKKCGFGTPAEYYCRYNDMDQRYLIWVMPKFTPEDRKKIEIHNERIKTDDVLRLARIDYRMRAVKDDMDLKEKIIIFDDNLDDRIIELMKVATVPYIRNELGIQSDIVQFRFTKMEKSGEYRFVVMFKDTKPEVLYFNMEQYEEIKKEYGDVIDSATEDGMNVIDAGWATETLKQIAEKNKDKE